MDDATLKKMRRKLELRKKTAWKDSDHMQEVCGYEASFHNGIASCCTKLIAEIDKMIRQNKEKSHD